MSLQALLEKITHKHKERQTAKLADYRSLVRSIADEEEPEPEYVERVLIANGKSFEDLQETVLLLRQRRALRAELDGVPALIAERRRVEKQIDAADRELELAEQKHTQTALPLQARLSEIRQAMQNAENAKQRLVQTCADEALLAELADVGGRLGRATTQRFEVQKKLADVTGWAEADRQELASGPMPVRAEELSERAARHEKQAMECRETLASLGMTIEELERREATLRERMLVP